MENLLATPVRPFEVMMGKILPYIAVGYIQVTLILLGWAFAQFPYLVEPDLPITSAAAPQITLQLLLGALAAGAILLFPSYYYLIRVFKAE